MGNLKGYRMASMYVQPELYERVRCAAYVLDENIYQFVEKAFTNAINLRLDKAQRSAVDAMAKQNVAKGRRRSRHNPVL